MTCFCYILKFLPFLIAPTTVMIFLIAGTGFDIFVCLFLQNKLIMTLNAKKKKPFCNFSFREIAGPLPLIKFH